MSYEAKTPNWEGIRRMNRLRVSRETVTLPQLLEAMTAVEAAGHRIRLIRVARIGVEGGPTSYMDSEPGAVMLLHPRDWGPLLAEIRMAGYMDSFITGHPHDTLYGVPVEVEGEAQRPRPTYTPPPPPPEPLRLRCSDFAGIAGVPPCCDGCHVDEDDYGIPLGGFLALNRTIEVTACCQVASFLDRPGHQLVERVARGKGWRP